MVTSKNLALLISVLDKKYKDPDKAVEKFVIYAKRKNLLYKLPNVLKHLERRAENRKDKHVTLTVSRDIAPETEKIIRTFIGAGEFIPIEKKIDPGILGGFIAEHNNLVYDGSIDRQLKRLKEVLLEN